MSFFDIGIEGDEEEQGMISIMSATPCGCYMTNASCGGSVDFGSNGQPTQACAQSVLSAQQPSHSIHCPG